jgi:hypothetical protein
LTPVAAFLSRDKAVMYLRLRPRPTRGPGQSFFPTRGSAIAMKKQVEYLYRLFYDLWNDFGSVYLVVRHSNRTIVGKRGFSEEEKKNGMVLVFNTKTSNALAWDAEGNLSCVLAFETRKEDLFIHHDDLFMVFSREAGVQFVRSDMNKISDKAPKADAGHVENKQVVSLSNFKKRRPHS